MNQTTIGPCNVTLKGGTYAKGAKLKDAKITRLGNPPNATLKIFEWDGGTRFKEFDRLTEAKITPSAKDDSAYTVVGISDQYLADVAGATPEDEEATVTWEVKLTGNCVDCG